MNAHNAERDSRRLRRCWLLFVVLGGLLLSVGRHLVLLQNWRAFIGTFFVLLTVGVPVMMLTFQQRGIVATAGLGIAVAPLALVVPAFVLRVIGLPFSSTAVVLLVGWVALQALFLWRGSRQVTFPSASPNWVAGLIGALVVLVIAYPQFISADVQLSFHGCYHSAIVYELRAGQFPPTNPVMPGEPINFYWLYHLLLALLMEALNVSPIQASAGLNVTVLSGVLCLGWALAGRLKLCRGARTLAFLLMAFGINWAGFVAWLEKTIETEDLATHRAMVIQGDPRVSGTASKFMNFGGFPVGYLSALLASYGLTRILEDRRGGFALLSIGTASALAFHTITGMALITFVPAALVTFYLVTWLVRRQPVLWRRLVGALGAIALGAMVAAPVVMPAAAALQGPGPSLGHTSGFVPTVAWALGPLVVLSVLGVLIFRRHARSVEWYLLCWGFALVVGALLTVFPENNQYKFIYLAAQPLGILVAWGVQRWGENARRPWGAHAVTGLFTAVVLLNVIVCGISYAGEARRSTLPIESTGVNVNITAPLENYREAYIWVREHTAPEALFVEMPQETPRRLFPLVTQRMLYVSAFGSTYTYQGSPEFEARWQTAGLLFTPSVPKQDALAQVAVAAPEVYLLLESDVLGANYNLLREEFGHVEQLSLTFTNPNVTIYRLEPSYSPPSEMGTRSRPRMSPGSHRASS